MSHYEGGPVFLSMLTLTSYDLLWRNREKFDFLMDKAHERTSNGHATNQNSSGFNQSEPSGYSGTFALDLIRTAQVQTFQVDEIMTSEGAQGRVMSHMSH